MIAAMTRPTRTALAADPPRVDGRSTTHPTSPSLIAGKRDLWEPFGSRHLGASPTSVSVSTSVVSTVGNREGTPASDRRCTFLFRATGGEDSDGKLFVRQPTINDRRQALREPPRQRPQDATDKPPRPSRVPSRHFGATPHVEWPHIRGHRRPPWWAPRAVNQRSRGPRSGTMPAAWREVES
jgi:hypothetical protein